jgi:F-type H+-transporting ATPase subunit b
MFRISAARVPIEACETQRKLTFGLFLFALIVVVLAAALPQAHAGSSASVQGEAAQPPAAAAPAEEHAQHGNGIVDVIARLVNFAIFAGTLVYLLRMPFRKYLADRSTQIRSDLVNAAETRREAAAQIEEIDRRMKALPRELDDLRERGAQEIEAEEARIQAAAAAERERLLAQARREIDLQVKVAERDLVAFAADLAVGLASERIKKNITDEDQKKLVDRYVQQLRPS